MPIIEVNQVPDILTALTKETSHSWYHQLVRHPFLFVMAGISSCLTPFFPKGFVVSAKPFFGGKMKIRLPASQDIFVTGVKGDVARMKLSKWMINHIKPGWTVMDVGAHVGFDTLLLYTLVKNTGHVIAFEPSPSAFEILQMNCIGKKNISVFNTGVSDEVGKQLLAERSIGHSEKNSFFFLAKAQTKLVPTTTIDAWCNENEVMPRFIQIDVEGWEWHVIKGAATVLKQRPILSISIATKHFEKIYYPVIESLLANGYLMYSLSTDGELLRCPDAWTELKSTRMHRDNFIFRPRR